MKKAPPPPQKTLALLFRADGTEQKLRQKGQNPSMKPEAQAPMLSVFVKAVGFNKNAEHWAKFFWKGPGETFSFKKRFPRRR